MTASPYGNENGQATVSNLAYVKFLFVIPAEDDDAAGTRMKAAGANIARGFFNDFDADGSRENQPFDTIQFLVRDGEPIAPPPGARPADRIGLARYVAMVSSKYRPRLDEIEEELSRRLGEPFQIVAVNGAVRHPRYTSAEMQQYTTRQAPPRRSGRVAPCVFIVPISKTPEWWQLAPLDRHSYFYPHVDQHSHTPVKGHAQAAEAGIPLLFRRIFHNPDGYQRDGEWDFLTYFECDETGVPVFERICHALRDPDQNPEWRFVVEGPIWRGRRVLRW